MSDNNNTDEVKRIVLIGYPGSGKTMLAIGLFRGGDRGSARISVDSEKNGKAVERLSGFIDKIDKDKEFPAPTQLHLDDKQDGTENNQEEKKNDRRTYPFQILWHGQKFDFEFEDYAGERVLNPEYQKAFFQKIVGQQAFGAVLLLNPGMPEFKNKNSDDKCKESSRRPEILSNFYVTAIIKLCESGCKNIVLAITASDLITHGGCLRREHNSIRWLKFKNACRGILNSFRSTKSGSEQDNRLCPRFKIFCKRVFQSIKKAVEDLMREDCASRYSRFKKVRDEIVGTLKLARKNKAWRLNYAVVPVTVTGHLEEQGEGEQRKVVVRLAEGRRNTAAEPFLWIINPWRGRIIKIVKSVTWILLVAFVVLFVGWLASRLWYGSRIDEYLESAETALGNFGNPEATGDFDAENAKKQRDIAEKSLMKVDNAFTFLARNKEKVIDKRLPQLLGTLLTNEVRLAYYNAQKGIDTNYYNNTNVSLEGRNVLKSWPYWKRSTHGNGVVKAAEVYREEKTQALTQEYVESNVAYLKGQLQNASKELPDDQKIAKLMQQVADCLKKMTDEEEKGNLRFWQNKVIRLWLDDVSKDDPEKFESRLKIVVTKESDLDGGSADQAIKRLWLKSERIKANVAVNTINKNDSAQLAAGELYTYIISSSGKNSPFRWYVFDACKEKFNKKVKDVLSSSNKRKDGFEELFRTAKKLKQIQAELERVGNDNLLEEAFGDCALFWLSIELKDNVKVSKDWLPYGFCCDSLWIRTDHLRDNPGSKPFKEGVSMTLRLFFSSNKSTSPCWSKEIGEWLEWEKIESDNPLSYYVFHNLRLNKKMEATEVLTLNVCGFHEDYCPDIYAPEMNLEFWPGWDDCEKDKETTYSSNKDDYPNKVFFIACLGGIQITDSPGKAFDKAQASANAREDPVQELRKKELEPAEKELQAEKQTEGSDDHE